jgi:predicted secreted protein
MNLVMIGHFKSPEDAKKTQKLIDQLSDGLRDKIDIGTSRERFSDEVLDLLREANCYILSPSELEHFLYDTRTRLEGDKIILTTDESEVSAFFKLMIEKGAKVEIFSAHDYPDAEYGRGK